MEKQQKIVEMAKDICRVKHICNDVCKPISACDALRYAERAVEAGYSKPKWISVDERLPEVRQRVLLYSYHDGVNTGYRADEIGRFYVDKSYPYRPTHWMPLPEAPKGGDHK